MFGPSSKKPSSDQLGLFNEVEALECSEEQDDSLAAIDVKPHQRVKRPRVSIPKDCPREDIIHDLPESDKVCPHDGATLEQVGSDDHEQLDVIPAKIKVLRHRRPKYACHAASSILLPPENRPCRLKKVSPTRHSNCRLIAHSETKAK
ncbi:MAG: transposase [Lentisphaeria bacterium]